ncbi:unnamed protein product [Pleuronectes platessa]|uniref:Uncharacterized protein n=1 Tax=Pleuronectes platessa TaxID=8262 RepID=A0A9N7UJQ4_PLEPL|nr:unnamed protein product [Pleuronectes platessa]
MSWRPDGRATPLMDPTLPDLANSQTADRWSRSVALMERSRRSNPSPGKQEGSGWPESNRISESTLQPLLGHMIQRKSSSEFPKKESDKHFVDSAAAHQLRRH